MTMTTDTRLILREDELDASVELFVLAEAALWSTAEAALQGHPSGLGRGHYRAAMLLKRRPGIGVQELAQLKIHPRAQIENRTLLASADRLYEQSLGELRDFVAAHAARFQAVLDTQDAAAIRVARAEFKDALRQVDEAGSL